jgi:hypothetical protein
MEGAAVSVRRFEDVFLETPVYFLLVALRDTYLLWVGSVPPRLDHMAVAVPTRFVPPLSNAKGQAARSNR